MRPSSKPGARQQAALEYLSVYATAILMITVAAVLLYHILITPSSRVPNTCTFAGGVTCADILLSSNSMTGNTAIMVVLNNAGSASIQSPSARVSINGVNTSSSNCLPSYVKAGGSIVCVINVTGRPGVNQLLGGKVYLTEQNCAFSSSGACQNPVNQIYTGTFLGTTEANQILKFQSTLTPSSSNVIATITVGTHPYWVAFNPAGTLAYAVNQGSGTVSVINPATNTVVNTITVGAAPGPIAFNPQGTYILVLNQAGSSVSVINPATNMVINTVSVGQTAEALVFNPQGTMAYVANWLSNTVSIINPASSSAGSITVGNAPYAIAFNPSGTLAYVTNEADSTVSVINTATNTVVNTITVSNGPIAVSFNPSGTLAYVSSSYSGIGTFNGIVSVINTATNTVVNTITLCSGGNCDTSLGAFFNPQYTIAYAVDANLGHAKFKVINTATDTVNTLSLGQLGMSITFNPQGTVALIPSGGTTAAVINTATNSVITTLAVGNIAAIAAFNPAGTLAYITNYGDGTVSAISLPLPPTAANKYKLTATLSLRGVPIKGATINFSASSPDYQISPKYASTNATGQATTYIWGSAPGFIKIYANFSNTISSNVVLGFG